MCNVAAATPEAASCKFYDMASHHDPASFEREKLSAKMWLASAASRLVRGVVKQPKKGRKKMKKEDFSLKEDFVSSAP